MNINYSKKLDLNIENIINILFLCFIVINIYYYAFEKFLEKFLILIHIINNIINSWKVFILQN